MSTKTKKIISAINMNPGNILLVFKDSDASIARNWRKLENHSKTPAALKSPLI